MKKGSKYINKDGVNKAVAPEELEEWLAQGWKLGNTNVSHPGHTPWNKGLTKDTSESVARIAASKVGVPRDKETRHKLSLSHVGKKHTEETRKKMSESHKGIVFTEERCKNISISRMGHEVTKETREKLSKAFTGKHLSQETKDKISSKLKGKVVSDETRRKISETHRKPEVRDKINEIKKRNGTFNTSNKEEQVYQELLRKYSKDDIIRQYKDSRYPFFCDFYIKSEDKFIECNFHWTHGEHPFDPDNKEDIELANKLKELSKKSKYYEIAYYVWTNLDVRKREIANKNNLNYEVLYKL